MGHDRDSADGKTLPSRRKFLRTASLITASAALAACGGTAPEVAAPSAAATASEAAGAVEAAPSLAASTAPAASTAAASTAAASAAAEPALGAELIGTLEGPQVIVDAAQYPKAFQEAPTLGELVKSGSLPPVAERLPAAGDVLVLKPLRETGTYGGVMRRGFTGPGDRPNGLRTAAHDHILYFDYSVTEVVPNVAKNWELSDDGKQVTITLRDGMKWSDGQPFSADDFVFWFDDMYKNADLVPSPSPALSVNGKQGTVEKVDDLTVRYTFEEPYYLFPEVLAGYSNTSSHANWGHMNLGGFAPAHYLKQFHPAYAKAEDVEKAIADAQAENLTTLMQQKNNWALNPELPVVTPWKTTTPANESTWVLERNPYFYAVDTEGNQLPYIDRIEMTLAEDLEVLNLRATAGEYDFQERHLNVQNLPVFLENQTQGDYKVHLDPSGDCTALIRFNMSYEADPEIAKWFANKDFRHALSLGVDRDQINETFMLGLGIPGSVVPADDNQYNPGPEYRELWAVLDVDQANALLDGIGLDKKDGSGMRLRSDGQGPLTLQMVATAAQFLPYAKMAEMLREQWKEIGITVEVEELERTLAAERTEANDVQLHLWDGGGGARVFGQPSNLFPDGTANSMGPLYGQWYATNGAEGKQPPEPMRKAMENYRAGFTVPEAERTELGKEFWRIQAEETYLIGLVGMAPAVLGVRLAKNKLGNVPGRQALALDGMASGISRPETFYWQP